jgi:hypothetical protein
MSVAASTKRRLLDMGVTLAFLALCLKLMVPVGFMPVGSSAGPVFGICSTAASSAIGKTSTKDDSSPKASMGCVFSLLHASVLAVADLAAPGLPLGKMAPHLSSHPGASPPRDRLFAPPPPSHAPPNGLALSLNPAG